VKSRDKSVQTCWLELLIDHQNEGENRADTQRNVDTKIYAAQTDRGEARRIIS